MKRRTLLPALALATVLASGCEVTDPVSPVEDLDLRPSLSVGGGEQANAKACWGQATAVYAAMGEMGEHASQQPTPRLGLANLARILYDMGVIEAPTMQALGAFVAELEGLSIDACM